jgi:putative PIN family toxin of toxin-antitoxin system
MNVVIDTNVLVSALYTSNSQSPTVRILELVFCRRLTLLCNEEILEEYQEVLKRPKFKFPESLVNNFIDSIRNIAIMTERFPSYTC